MGEADQWVQGSHSIHLPTLAQGNGVTIALFKDLYPHDAAQRKELLSNSLMSNGKIVDGVLVWQLPETEKERAKLIQDVTQHHGRHLSEDSHVSHFYYRDFFESMLLNTLTQEAHANTVAELAQCTDEVRLKELEEDVINQKTQLGHTVEIERELGEDGRTVFVKLHVPYDTLLAVAEEVHLVMPLKPTNRKWVALEDTFWDKLGKWMPFRSAFKVPDLKDDATFCAEFKVKMKDHFLNIENETNFFSSGQRNMLLRRILQQMPYERLKQDGSNSEHFGINRMLRKGMYTAAYPLHDSSSTKDPEPKRPRQRYELAQTWADFHMWYKQQPLERIRRYFGEVVAFYFLWLQFYIRFLIPASIVGIVIFIYGLGTYKDQTDSAEVCASNLLMCGQCATCPQWRLSSSCSSYEFGWVFDNGGTVFFAFFMALWATLFLEFWKRETATKAFEWDVSQFEENEPFRPEFRPTDHREDPVTQLKVPYFSSASRTRRFVVSILVIFLMLSLVIWAVIAVIIFRLAVQVALYENYASIRDSSAAITSALAAILNLITIIILNMIYKKVAYQLTEWENFEKQTDYEEALSLKVSLFQFVNSYASIFYIAFFKGQFVGRPGDRGTLFGYRQEDCATYGCMLELTIQLGVIFVGKQAISNAIQILTPILQGLWAKRTMLSRMKKNAFADDAVEKKKPKIETRWERQFVLTEYPGLFEQYLSMVIQFGYVTLFVAAFPLAPLFALLNNFIEMRVDAKTLVFTTRRPFADRAEDIGVWYGVLAAIGYFAIITNAFVIAVPSSFIPKLVYFYTNSNSMDGYVNVAYSPSPITTGNTTDSNCYYKGFRNADGTYSSMHYQIMMARLAFIIVFEHAVFFTKLLAAWLIPDVPANVKLAVRREEYEARLAVERSVLGPDAPTKVVSN